MTDFDPAATEAFPLEQASDWIARWHKIGGGFWARPDKEAGGFEIQLARNAIANAECDDIYANDAERLQTEILSAPRLKAAVMTLVSQAHQRAAKDLATTAPAGNA
jgi:hypothetical protein